MKRLLAVACSAALFAAIPTAANAVPKGGETFVLDCGHGLTYQVATNKGNGDWTPAFILGSQQRIIPTSFGVFHFLATDPDGNVLFAETQPANAKGGGHVKVNRPRVTCSFEQSQVLTETDPESGLPAGTTLTFSGSVTGFLTGHR
jgi:opacity protein-like surface antigen